MTVLLAFRRLGRLAVLSAFQMITRSLSSDQVGLDLSLPRTSSTAPSDADTPETSSLRSLIQERNVAALAQFQAIDLKAVARLCLDMVEAYPDEVTVVLWNRKVALQAAQLLKAMARNPDAHSGARGAVALARAILGAGHRMGQPVDGKKGDWPAEVNAMLEERYAADVRYWVAKIQKFDEKPYKHGVQTFIALGNPFSAPEVQFIPLSRRHLTCNFCGTRNPRMDKNSVVNRENGDCPPRHLPSTLPYAIATFSGGSRTS